ncbi:MAG TPA: T9SS type A sorting domain-containing protein [Puia sp.]|nr:T9SS type A sorting domain-containing protein [Puia sp.]
MSKIFWPTFIPIGWCLFIFSSNGYAQSPGGVNTNLQLWVKAGSALPIAGGTLTRWPDQTGLNTFTTSGTASSITTVVSTVNFNPVVRFTGVATLQGNRSIQWSECTAVVSWAGAANTERGTTISPTTSGTEPNDASRYFFRSGVEAGPSGYVYAGMGVDSIGFEYAAAPPANQANIFTASGVDDVLTKNGLDARVGDLFGGFTKRATVMNGIPQIGDRSTDDAKLKGDIAEIIVYGSNNATNRNKVESYLALKYGLSLGTAAQPVNYTSSAGTVFWPGLSGYQHNIFGIGADAASGLTQTQSNSMNSGSGTGAGQSARGNLVLNAVGSLSDQQFLMIGTDSASLGEETITAAIGPSVAISSLRLIRTWKVRNTHAVGNVRLTFNTSGLGLSGGTTASNYWLVTDNDGDGNFTTGTQSTFHASSLTSNILTFNSIPLNDGVVFTIITKPSSMSVLSIDCQDFTTTVQQTTALLQWTIGNETNMDYYEVQRSSNATSFLSAGSVTARNETGPQSYTFRDQLSPGNYIYRIRMVDRDGNDQFSGLRPLTIAGSTLLQIRSNPVVGNRLQLAIDLPQNNTALISIINRQGKVLLQREASLQQGFNLVTMDCSSFAGGLYFVRLEAGSERKTLSFLK